MPKQTFPVSATAGPAMAMFDDALVLAFPDQNRKITLLPSDPAKGDASLTGLRTVEEWTNFRPALATFHGDLFLAWTGNDPLGRVNLIRMPALNSVPRGPDPRLHPRPGVSVYDKVTFDATAVGGPGLAVYQGKLFLTFAGGGGMGGGPANRKINLAWTEDGNHWEMPGLVLEHQTSPSAPMLAEYPIMALLVFRGTDQRVYVASAQGDQFNQFDWPAPSLQQLGDTTHFAPGLCSHNYDISDWAFSIVYTGSPPNDPRQHLYEFGLGGNTYLLDDHVQRTRYTDCSAFEPSVFHLPGIGLTDWVYAWAGTDDQHRINLAMLDDLVAG
jgi:hypothetical protein